MPKELFDDDFIKIVKRARKLNKDTEISGDIYFHPTENHIVVKTIDLTKKHPLCEVNSRPSSSSKERWLEAYLIGEAKNNNWILKLANKNKRYRFLSSQLKFRAEDSEPGKPLDLLLYEMETKHLVILELKSIRQLKEAMKELKYYAEEIEKYEGEIAEVFDLERIVGTPLGYIVCPKGARDTKQRDLRSLSPYGLIEYVMEYDGIAKPWDKSKPWDEFKKAKEEGKKVVIRFTYTKEPG